MDTRLIGHLNVLRRQFLAGKRQRAFDEQSTLEILGELQNVLETEVAKLRVETVSADNLESVPEKPQFC